MKNRKKLLDKFGGLFERHFLIVTVVVLALMWGALFASVYERLEDVELMFLAFIAAATFFFTIYNFYWMRMFDDLMDRHFEFVDAVADYFKGLTKNTEKPKVRLH